MKKLTTIVTIMVLIVAVIFSALPSRTALAAKDPVNVNLTVRDHMDGLVTLTLTDADNQHYTFTFDHPDMFEVSVPQGHYAYYASTPCGNQSGEFNLNVSKILYLSCAEGREIALTKPGVACSNYDFWHWYLDSNQSELGGHWHSGVDVDYNYQQNDSNGYWELRCTDGDPNYGFAN